MSFNRKTIVVVDDDRIFTLYLSVLLRRMGFKVMSSKGGPEALDLIKSSSPDMLLLDADTKARDGLDTLCAIREHEEFSKIPAVLMSTGQDVPQKTGGPGSDYAGLLPKPVPMDGLHSVLQECIYSPLGWKRRFLRVDKDIRVTVVYQGVMRDLHIETLSEGGAFIRTVEPYPVGAELEVNLPSDYGTLRLKGTVAYKRGPFGEMKDVKPGVAVEFSGLSEAEALALNRIVTGHITAGFDRVAGDERPPSTRSS